MPKKAAPKKTATKSATTAKVPKKAVSAPVKTTKATAKPAPGGTSASKPSLDFTQFVVGLRDLCDAYLSSNGSVATSKATAEADTDPTSDPERFRAHLESLSEPGLRQLALRRDFKPKEVKNADRAELIEGIFLDEFPADADDEDVEDAEVDEDEDEETEEDSEEEDEEEGDEDDEDAEEESEEDEEGQEYTREELLAMNLRALKKIVREAAEEEEEEVPDMDGWDKDTVASYILGESDEEGEDDADEEEEDEEEAYTEEDYNGMNEKELRTVAKENGVKLKATDKKPAIIRKLLA